MYIPVYLWLYSERTSLAGRVHNLPHFVAKFIEKLIKNFRFLCFPFAIAAPTSNARHNNNNKRNNNKGQPNQQLQFERSKRVQ